MSIALYDADFQRYGLKVSYSYNLMKLASYYKQKHEIVNFISDLSRADLYTKVYYHQDYDDPFDPEIIKHDNIEVIGYKVSGGRPYELPPGARDCKCDCSIYSRAETHQKNDEHRKSYLSYSMNILLENDEPLGSSFYGRYGLIIHNYDICSVPDWYDRMLNYKKKIGKYSYSFATHMPQHISSLENLQLLSQFTYNRFFTNFQIDQPLSTYEYLTYLKWVSYEFSEHTAFAVNTKPTYTKTEIAQLEKEVAYRNFLARLHHRQFVLYNKGICENPNLDGFFDLLISWNNTSFVVNIDRRETFLEYLNHGLKKKKNEIKKQTHRLIELDSELNAYARINPDKIAREGGIWPHEFD